MFYDHGFGFMGLHALGWLFWLVLIGALVFLLFKRTAGRPEGPGETPLETLQRRLAQGEIDLAQYEQLKSVLERDQPRA